MWSYGPFDRFWTGETGPASQPPDWVRITIGPSAGHVSESDAWDDPSPSATTPFANAKHAYINAGLSVQRITPISGSASGSASEPDEVSLPTAASSASESRAQPTRLWSWLCAASSECNALQWLFLWGNIPWTSQLLIILPCFYKSELYSYKLFS